MQQFDPDLHERTLPKYTASDISTHNAIIVNVMNEVQKHQFPIRVEIDHVTTYVLYAITNTIQEAGYQVEFISPETGSEYFLESAIAHQCYMLVSRPLPQSSK